MISILPAIEAVGKICGKQKQWNNNELRMTKHCLTANCEEGKLLYHTLTGMLVLIPLGDSLEANREDLYSNWFLVSKDFDEQKHAAEVRQIAKTLYQHVHHKTRFTILTTTDCNARCFYCYEAGIKRFPMTEETARKVADYIIRESEANPVVISWFGGEPLYNSSVIDTICNTLSTAHMCYESRMTTNAYYLNKTMVKHARDRWYLNNVQITIDGTESVYNRIKAYIDVCSNPYQRVMDNIHAALDAGMNVTLRLNMDAGNAGNLLQLVDDIGSRFNPESRLEVYPALLREFAGGIHSFKDQQELLWHYQSINERIDHYKLSRDKSLPRVILINSCMADDDASEVILPDGRVGRCKHYKDEIVTGSIDNDNRDMNITRAWCERLSTLECAYCAIYPTCRKLKMCEWNTQGCTKIDRTIRVLELQKQIQKAYHEYKRRTEG